MTSIKYLSKYSNGKEVSAAQYITEIICEHYAKKEKLDLHYRFWTRKEWATYYRNQIGTANKLLKKYSAKAIIKALNDPRSYRIYSLRAPHLVSIIEQAEEEIKHQNTELTKQYNRKQNSTFAKNSTKKNILSKLKDMDNDS